MAKVELWEDKLTDLESMRKLRSCLRVVFESVSINLSGELDKQVPNLSLAQSYFMLLDEKKNHLKSLDRKIHIHFSSSECSSTDLLQDIVKADEYSLTLITLKIRLDEALMIKKDTPLEQKEDFCSIAKFNDQDCNIRIPKTQLCEYNGDPIGWIPFWNKFKLIHNAEEIDLEDKFRSLVQSTTPQSEPRQIVEEYYSNYRSILLENYQKAIDSLTTQFGKQELLIELLVKELVQELLTLGTINQSHFDSNLLELIFKLDSHLKNLESLGVEPAILCPVVESFLPKELIKTWRRSPACVSDTRESQLKCLMSFLKKEVKEKRQELTSVKIPYENNLYITIQIIFEEEFEGHQGNGLFDQDMACFKSLRVERTATLQELLKIFSETVTRPFEHLRPWEFTIRSNQTYRPSLLSVWFNDLSNITVQDVFDGCNLLFLEVLPPDSGLVALPSFDCGLDVLIFFKMYDPKNKKIRYCGHEYVRVCVTLSDLVPTLNKRAGFPPDTQLLIFEEIKPNMVELIDTFKKPLCTVVDELMNGFILVFQKKEKVRFLYDLPTCKDYFVHLYHRVEVTFYNMSMPEDPGFTLELSSKMDYKQMFAAVLERLNISEPCQLLFYKKHMYKEGPGAALECQYMGTLKNVFPDFRQNKTPKKLYYQQVPSMIIRSN